MVRECNTAVRRVDARRQILSTSRTQNVTPCGLNISEDCSLHTASMKLNPFSCFVDNKGWCLITRLWYRSRVSLLFIQFLPLIRDALTFFLEFRFSIFLVGLLFVHTPPPRMLGLF